MADLLLGMDVGTTATKAVLFDVRGNLAAAASRGYGLITPQPGWVEQDPSFGELLSRQCAPSGRNAARATGSLP